MSVLFFKEFFPHTYDLAKRHVPDLLELAFPADAQQPRAYARINNVPGYGRYTVTWPILGIAALHGVFVGLAGFLALRGTLRGRPGRFGSAAGFLLYAAMSAAAVFNHSLLPSAQNRAARQVAYGLNTGFTGATAVALLLGTVARYRGGGVCDGFLGRLAVAAAGLGLPYAVVMSITEKWGGPWRYAAEGSYLGVSAACFVVHLLVVLTGRPALPKGGKGKGKGKGKVPPPAARGRGALVEAYVWTALALGGSLLLDAPLCRVFKSAQLGAPALGFFGFNLALAALGRHIEAASVAPSKEHAE